MIWLSLPSSLSTSEDCESIIQAMQHMNQGQRHAVHSKQHIEEEFSLKKSSIFLINCRISSSAPMFWICIGKSGISLNFKDWPYIENGILILISNATVVELVTLPVHWVGPSKILQEWFHPDSKTSLTVFSYEARTLLFWKKTEKISKASKATKTQKR